MPFVFGPGAYRLLLALLVLVHHTSSLGVGAGAVYVFFALSGYWMHEVWGKKYAEADHGYRTFIVARLIRLLPLFWLANVIAYAVDIHLGKFSVDAWLAQMQSWPKLLHFLLSHLFLMGYPWLDHMAIVPAWSLVVELQFYVVLPLMVAAMHALGWWVLPLSAAVGVGVHGTQAFGSVLGYAFFFFLGMWSSRCRWTPSSRLARHSAAWVALMAGILMAWPATRGVLIGGAVKGDAYLQWNELANAVLAMALMPLTVWSAELKAGARDRMWGDMSYAVYLLHAPLVALYSDWFGQLPAVRRLPYWLVLVGVVLGASWLAWKLVDKPVMAWRERYLAARV